MALQQASAVAAEKAMALDAAWAEKVVARQQINALQAELAAAREVAAREVAAAKRPRR